MRFVTCHIPAVRRSQVAGAAGAAAGGAGSQRGAGGVQVLPLWDITPTRRSSLREQRRRMTAWSLCTNLISLSLNISQHFSFFFFNLEFISLFVFFFTQKEVTAQFIKHCCRAALLHPQLSCSRFYIQGYRQGGLNTFPCLIVQTGKKNKQIKQNGRHHLKNYVNKYPLHFDHFVPLVGQSVTIYMLWVIAFFAATISIFRRCLSFLVISSGRSPK